ncbi:hypothetical protein [Chitinophaga filiformis]|uniref:Lipoprotein n=1 Tax=Chitinophaga filiformis TaxID=104663 RepID=A0A1G7QHH9_CHIFI|nr:hypothetical protein [Chitinophaga filiformis]SDF97070.1 hypothetical protein SAMN04488121_10333 [Chitinophaga filiformis]
MILFRRSLLPLLFSVFSLYACGSGQQKKAKTRTPVVCTDSSKHSFTLDTVKGYELKPGKELTLLLNIESFNTKEEFDQYLMRPPIPADSTPPSLNFKDNWLVAILVDNRTPNPSYPNEWIDISTKLTIDSAYTENCKLTIPFYLLADEGPVFGAPAPQKRVMLFSIPRSAQFNQVFVQNKGGSLSRSLDVPAAEE